LFVAASLRGFADFLMLLFVSRVHGIQSRATFANGEQSACGHLPDYSCLLRKGRVIRGVMARRIDRHYAVLMCN
jgi:hypothetical protein